jgi:hypothetical protein
MAFEEINNELINDFNWSILNRFNQHCNKEGIQLTFSNFTKYLIQCNVIQPKTVSKYMVMELYPECLYSNNSKMDAITEISERTGISEKHVYNMVQHPEHFGYAVKQKGKKENTVE